jgi:transposase
LDDFLKSPEDFDFNTANWTGSLMREHIKKKFNVLYKQAAVYSLMRQLGFSFQRTKGYYPERDEKKRNETKAEIKKK